jgi:hypothetical protein
MYAMALPMCVAAALSCSLTSLCKDPRRVSNPSQAAQLGNVWGPNHFLIGLHRYMWVACNDFLIGLHRYIDQVWQQMTTPKST